ncbi:hypothetical protein [Rhodococcoides kyotonense]|uniref:Uncharacterized protein n=1 Tax=Rhodococcoides kyotonense TaxID=398843 RepID=A0A239JKY6_9NOCA|nr:hypothetical protein [Rhodococcus kyotonensis]SNT06459.1 hypothetical protein SAMN05421642_108286 [Rhodococcus kyotonensis]
MTRDVKLDLYVGGLCLAGAIAMVVVLTQWLWVAGLMLFMAFFNLLNALKKQHRQIIELQRALDQSSKTQIRRS